jgi:hypothetical protein
MTSADKSPNQYVMILKYSVELYQLYFIILY